MDAFLGKELSKAAELASFLLCCLSLPFKVTRKQRASDSALGCFNAGKAWGALFIGCFGKEVGKSEDFSALAGSRALHFQPSDGGPNGIG